MKSKKILTFTASAIIGLILGIALVELTAHIMESGVNASDPAASTDKPLDMAKLAMAILSSLVSLAICAVLQIILHEAGHLVMGLATGYRFLSFRIFSWVLKDTGKGLKWSRYSLPGTLGQCLMEPGDFPDDDIPYFWYNAGGVLMNLLLTLTGVLAMLYMNLGMLTSTFFMMLFITGLFLLLTNGIPMSNQGVSNDGMNILYLAKDKTRRILFRDTMSIAALMTRGKRMSEIPGNLIYKDDLREDATSIELSAKSFHMAFLEDCGALLQARTVGESILRHKNAGNLFQMETGGDVLLLEIMTTRREEVIKRLWNEKMERYIRMTEKSSAMKTIILYAHKTLIEGKLDAESPRQKLEASAQDAAFPGEARTALFLLTDIERQIQTIQKSKETGTTEAFQEEKTLS